MASIEFGEAVPEQAAVIGMLLREHGPNAWNWLPEDNVVATLAELAAGRGGAMLAWDGGDIVGAMIWRRDDPYPALRPADIPPEQAAYLAEAVVHRDYAGRGLGGRLLRELNGRLASRGIRWLAAERHEENLGSAGMMRKAGYKVLSAYDDPQRRHAGNRRTAVCGRRLDEAGSRLAHVRRMAEYNHWMNEKLYHTLEELPEATLSGNMGAFFGSLLGTLNHLLVADLLWMKRFAELPEPGMLAVLRERAAPVALNSWLSHSLAGCLAERRLLDRLLLDWCAALTEAELDQPLSYRNMRGVAATKPLFPVLMHLFNHQTHHRGQLSTLMSQLGLDPGVTDLVVLIDDV
ncbi:DinB family protein [Crenobacter sp. SG2305]|uniref:DinB family protein n=1 Tax=Crenobacter oryzisoli TaxID=3056844 RepID=UPI0025AA76B7|nr:DinB family protein [Crenobacter sp. SG2305]MDN0083711.1 DinB family protein [Crenobacter sp. SG2305]